MHACTHACMSACMHACMHACMYVSFPLRCVTLQHTNKGCAIYHVHIRHAMDTCVCVQCAVMGPPKSMLRRGRVPDIRKVGRCGWKPSSNSNFSAPVVRAYPLVEIRQTAPCRILHHVDNTCHVCCCQSCDLGRVCTLIRMWEASPTIVQTRNNRAIYYDL